MLWTKLREGAKDTAEGNQRSSPSEIFSRLFSFISTPPAKEPAATMVSVGLADVNVVMRAASELNEIPDVVRAAIQSHNSIARILYSCAP